MTKKEALEQLREHGRVQVSGPCLKKWQQDLVDRGIVFLEAYQDTPRDRIYFTRPIRYYLVASKWPP